MVANVIDDPDCTVSTGRPISPEQFRDLLIRSTLSERRPVDNLACVKGMIEHSNLVVSAWKGDDLIGIARSVTDFHYACYLSDLAVDQKFQNFGIGRAMVQETRSRVEETCKIILIAAPAAKNYYARLGFEHNDRCWVLE